MYLKFIRKLNFYWGLIELIFLTTIFSLLLTLIKDEKYQVVVMDMIVEWASAIALFFGFYLIRFCFTKSKYPFITCEPWEIETPFLNKIAKYKWVWIIGIPVILAIIVPIIWFCLTIWTMNVSNHIKGIRIGLFVANLVLTSLHNLIYIQILWKKSKTMEQEFEMKNFQ